jgi:pimeloyl-ACP methyl ester carboxylesterase
MSNPKQIEAARLGSTNGNLGGRDGGSAVELDGVSLAWEESGEGVPVVCLHTAGQESSDFRKLREQAPAGCRLLLLDWPGHGRSGEDPVSFTVERCVDLLTGFLNALGLRNAVLLGTEFGGAVALAFALRHPPRVRGLVLCQPAGLLPEVKPARRAALSKALQRARGWLARKPQAAGVAHDQQRADALRGAHVLQCNQAALSVLALEDSLRSGLAQLLCPILIVLAERSRAYPLRRFEKVLAPVVEVSPAERPGRPRLAVFPGAQSPLWEDPERMAQVLSGFAAATVALDAHPHSWTLAAADWPARGLNQWLCTHPGCLASQALPVDQNPNLARGRS